MKEIPDDKSLDAIYEIISSEDSLPAHITNARGVPEVVDGPYESHDTCLDALKRVGDYVCTHGHDLCSTSYPGPDCPYCEPVCPSFVAQLAQLTGISDFKFGVFRPCFVYHETMDWLEYLEEDCCTITEHQKGTNICLLRKWDGEKYCGIVGIKIEGFSAIATPELIEAFKAYNKRPRNA